MRKMTSIILFIAFIAVSITGIQLSVGHSPDGGGKHPAVQSQELINSVASTVSNVPRQESIYPKKLHEWAGYSFLLAGILHLLYNKKTMLYYLRIKS